MTQKRTSKRAFIMSVLSLMICITMLIGSTFAWFTDSASTGVNKITAGNLDIALYKGNVADGAITYTSEVTNATKLFKENTLWEPGYTEVAYLKIDNIGDLALKYQLNVNVFSEIIGESLLGNEIKLSEVLKYDVVEIGATEFYADRSAALKAVQNEANLATETITGEMTAEADAKYLAIIVYMPTDVGNEANYRGEKIPSIQLGVNLIATQLSSESDSYDNTYDKNALYPVVANPIDITLSEKTDVTANVSLANDVVIADMENDVTVTIPKEKYESTENDVYTTTVDIELVSSDADSTNYEINISISDSEKNEITIIEPVTVEIELISGLKNVKVTHNGVAMTLVDAIDELDADQEYFYNKSTGKLYIMSKTFSPFEITYDTVDRMKDWTADCELCAADNPHIIADVEDLNNIRNHTHNGTVTGYFKLANNIVFDDTDFSEGGICYNNGKGWLAIGHNGAENNSWWSSNGISFVGELDGNGKTISGIKTDKYSRYQGLFGGLAGNAYIHDVTLKDFEIKAKAAGILAGQTLASSVKIENVTIDSCDLRSYYEAGKFSGIFVGTMYGGTAKNINIKNSSYERLQGNVYAGNLITSDIANTTLENFTITGCEIVVAEKAGILAHKIGDNVTMKNINIDSTSYEPWAGEYSYLFHTDNRSNDTVKLSDIAINLTMKPINYAYQNAAPTNYIIRNPKTSIAAIPMENVTMNLVYANASEDAGTAWTGSFVTESEKNVTYVIENSTNYDKMKLVPYAKDIIAYTNGGTFADGTAFAENALATPIKDGCTFGGWYDNADLEGNSADTFTAGKTYYAKWN